ncbi:hypothetical protein GGR56DRAFT_622499 [Xylariaceae sp. FL0804]|nr:hypothetical protein GGR56DRAFT_622499 [Xylariaceae sp. FL0804]
MGQRGLKRFKLSLLVLRTATAPPNSDWLRRRPTNRSGKQNACQSSMMRDCRKRPRLSTDKQPDPPRPGRD